MPCKAPLPACADSEWTVGEPDAIFAIPPFEVPPEGTVDYTCMRAQSFANIVMPARE